MKKLHKNLLWTAAVTVAAMGMTACSSSLWKPEVTVRSALKGTAGPSHDPLYDSAVSAINNRDYALALDYLQAARAKDPNDIRTLNALGVVYDKLGRFDLSARYYAQAGAVDPQSRIVAENLAYSRILQGFANADAPRNVASEQLPPASPVSHMTADLARPATVAVADVINDKVAVTPPATPIMIIATNPPLPAVPPLPPPAHKVAAVPVPAQAMNGMAPDLALPWISVWPATPHKVAAIPLQTPKMDVIGANMALPWISVLPTTPLRVAAVPLQARTMRDITANLPSLPVRAIVPQMVAAITPPAPKVRIIAANLLSPPLQPAAPRKMALLVPQGPKPGMQKVEIQKPQSQKIVTIGHPLTIVNAAGPADRVDILRQRLNKLGWSMRPSELARVQAATSLYFTPKNSLAAQAMQRTLPFPVRMIPGAAGADLKLVIGQDYLGWKPKNARIAALWQKRVVVAALAKRSTERGR